MRAGSATAALCVLATGCGIYRAPPVFASSPAHENESAAPNEPLAPPSSPPEPITERIHLVVREGPTPMECADINWRITPPDPLPEGWQSPSLQELVASIVGVGVSGVTALPGPCAEGLSDHAAFGQCAISVDQPGDDGQRIELSGTIFYYGAGVIERDRRPRGCAELGGEWGWLE